MHSQSNVKSEATSQCTPRGHAEEVKVQLHSPSSALDAGEWLASPRNLYTSKVKKSHYPLNTG
jgi:hypothetical protein